jgi:predicted enzyme related to lactoylglutathione lyase
MDNPVVHFEILGSDGIKLIDFYRGVFEYDNAMRKVVGPRIMDNVNT